MISNFLDLLLMDETNLEGLRKALENIEWEKPEKLSDEEIIKGLKKSFAQTKKDWNDKEHRLKIDITVIPEYNEGGNAYKVVFHNDKTGASCEFIEEYEPEPGYDWDETEDFILCWVG